MNVLPNTAGCHSVKEAVTTAQMAREVFGTDWIKLEVIGDDDTLQPDVFGLVEAARILSAEGFKVFPYTTEDLVVAERLLEAGCRVLMPWGCADRLGAGAVNVHGLRAMRAHFPDLPLIVDAGIGVPSHAAARMELGYDAVLLNTAVAGAGDPVAMARAFALRSRPAASAYEADRWSRATWPRPRRRCSDRRCSHEARSLLPHRRQRRLDRAAGAARRQAGAAAGQGPARGASAPRSAARKPLRAASAAS